MRELIRLDLQREDSIPEKVLSATLHVGERDGFLPYWFAEDAEASMSEWRAFLRETCPQTAGEAPDNKNLAEAIETAIQDGSRDGWIARRSHVPFPDAPPGGGAAHGDDDRLSP